MDLSVEYMGLKLKNPLMVSSSGITGSIEGVQAAAASGASAVVLKSIFAEEIIGKAIQDSKSYELYTHPEASDYIYKQSFQSGVQSYLDLLKGAKKAVPIPVIANLNAGEDGDWLSFVKQLEGAGADALELNLFIIPKNIEQSSSEIEDRYLKLFSLIRKQTSLPLAVKLGSFFTNFGNVAKRFKDAGADALVLFNRFHTIGVSEGDKGSDFEEGKWLSAPGEHELSDVWIQRLYNQISIDYSATSGVRTGEQILDLVLSGASAVQIATILYMNGVDYLKTLLEQLEFFMKERKIESLSEVKGQNALKEENKEIEDRRIPYLKAIMALNEMRAK